MFSLQNSVSSIQLHILVKFSVQGQDIERQKESDEGFEVIACQRLTTC